MIKPFADAHNILVISQGSTASSLAVPGDNIFRFCPNDRREAEALVALLQHDGIRAIVPLWRNDAGNNGLHVDADCGQNSLDADSVDQPVVARDALRNFAWSNDLSDSARRTHVRNHL